MNNEKDLYLQFGSVQCTEKCKYHEFENSQTGNIYSKIEMVTYIKLLHSVYCKILSINRVDESRFVNPIVESRRRQPSYNKMKKKLKYGNAHKLFPKTDFSGFWICYSS